MYDSNFISKNDWYYHLRLYVIKIPTCNNTYQWLYDITIKRYYKIKNSQMDWCYEVVISTKIQHNIKFYQVIIKIPTCNNIN